MHGLHGKRPAGGAFQPHIRLTNAEGRNLAEQMGAPRNKIRCVTFMSLQLITDPMSDPGMEDLQDSDRMVHNANQ